MTIEKLRPVFSGRVIRVNVETVRLPNGHVAELEIIHHPGGAAAVAIDHDRRVCLIRQFRHAANGWIWELPAGKLEPDEPPTVNANPSVSTIPPSSPAHGTNATSAPSAPATHEP